MNAHRQHDLINRGIGASVLRRHQFGGNRERRRDREAETEAGDQAQDEQLLEICARAGSSRVHNVLRMTPTCMTARRLMRSDIAAAAKPPMTTRKVGHSGKRTHRVGAQMQRNFGEHQQRAR